MPSKNLISKILISRSILAFFFISVGILHFVKPEPFVEIVPEVLPAKTELVYISGLFEILGGIGMLVARTRAIAGWGLIALLIAVFPANINMAMNSNQFPKIPELLLWLRLPLQPVLIYWVWKCMMSKKEEPD
jgi:Predicted membrane protein